MITGWIHGPYGQSELALLQLLWEELRPGQLLLGDRGFCTWGLPLELVQRVTGHRTVAAGMKHYFRPGREDFRAAIFKAMPRMLADGGPRPAKDEMRAILERMSEGTWKRDSARLMKLIEET